MSDYRYFGHLSFNPFAGLSTPVLESIYAKGGGLEDGYEEETPEVPYYAGTLRDVSVTTSYGNPFTYYSPWDRQYYGIVRFFGSLRVYFSIIASKTLQKSSAIQKISITLSSGNISDTF